MLSILNRNFVATQLRTALAIIALACTLGALFPDSDLIPFRKALQASRNIEGVTQATRWLFFIGACVSAWAFAAWHWIRQGVVIGVQSITRLSNRAFWGLAWGSSLGLRLPTLLLPSAPTSDQLWHHYAAMAMAAGRGLEIGGVPTAYRPPGYPALLALTYRLFGPYPECAWFWGIASTSIIMLTTYCIADRLYGKTIARMATLVIAFYPALILYTGQLGSDLVFTAGLMLVWYMITLRPPYRWFDTVGIGVALGLLTLTRSVAIGLVLVVPFLWFIKQANLRKLFCHFILLICAFAVCLIPWILRNYAIFDTLTLGTNMGLNLYIGNHVGASGTYEDVLGTLAVSNHNEANIDRIYLQAAIKFIVADPVAVFLILPKKIIHLYLLEVWAAQTQFQDLTLWLKYGSYGIAQIFYLPILACFAVRVTNLLDPTTRPHGIQWIGFVVIIYFTLMAMVFVGLDRYRLPFLPWMIIEGSIVLAWLADLSQTKRRA